MPTYSGWCWWCPPDVPAGAGAIAGVSLLACAFLLRRHQKNKPPSKAKAAMPPATGPAIQALEEDGFGSSVGAGGGGGGGGGGGVVGVGLLVDVGTVEVTDGSGVDEVDVVIRELLVDVVVASTSR